MVIIIKSYLNVSYLSFCCIVEKCDLFLWLLLVNVIFFEKKDLFLLNNYYEVGYNYY